ncbi:MAG: hypothetical protein COB98_11545 [Flavobacteriaceae bacterium]|nr:MAG: hypothetical protein COB98_11545 [Flavobacteriaceae bacterium]
MKKIIGIIVLVFSITASINAQENTLRKGMSHPNFTPEQQATLHTKKMTLALDLNTAQQQEIHQLHLAMATDRKSMRAEFKNNREQRVALSDTQKYEKAIARLDKKIAHKAQMKRVLNKDQYEKWSEMHVQKMNQHRKKGFHKRTKGSKEKRRMQHKK